MRREEIERARDAFDDLQDAEAIYRAAMGDVARGTFQFAKAKPSFGDTPLAKIDAKRIQEWKSAREKVPPGRCSVHSATARMSRLGDNPAASPSTRRRHTGATRATRHVKADCCAATRRVEKPEAARPVRPPGRPGNRPCGRGDWVT